MIGLLGGEDLQKHKETLNKQLPYIELFKTRKQRYEEEIRKIFKEEYNRQKLFGYRKQEI